jgi:hypothetical protein
MSKSHPVRTHPANLSHRREYIASFPNDVLAARFEASKDGSLNLRASFSRSTGIVENKASIDDGVASLTLRGSSGQPDNEGPILFSGKARFVVDGGRMTI